MRKRELELKVERLEDRLFYLHGRLEYLEKRISRDKEIQETEGREEHEGKHAEIVAESAGGAAAEN